jgi:hypothetical protein
MGIFGKLTSNKVTKSPASYVIENDLKKLGISQNASTQDKPKPKEYKLEPIWTLLDRECVRK